MSKASRPSRTSSFFEAFAARQRPEAARILRPSVARDGDRLRQLLTTKTAAELTAHEIRTEVEGNLWMLGPEAFLFFLPAFLQHALESYASVSVFASELVGALTEPSRVDVEGALDRATRAPAGLGLPQELGELARQQQLEWFDSGAPSAIFRDRFDSLTPNEGAAIHAFFLAFEQAHGANFPFGELQTAVERRWARYPVVGGPDPQLES